MHFCIAHAASRRTACHHLSYCRGGPSCKLQATSGLRLGQLPQSSGGLSPGRLAVRWASFDSAKFIQAKLDCRPIVCTPVAVRLLCAPRGHRLKVLNSYEPHGCMGLPPCTRLSRRCASTAQRGSSPPVRPKVRAAQYWQGL